MKILTLNGVVDENDVLYARARGLRIVAAQPCPIQKNGKINPHVTQFFLEDGKTVSIFHIKPIYYETLGNEWRPLSEITTHHGNRKIELNNKWRLAHPRFLDWLAKRQRLLGSELLIPSPFGMVDIAFQSLIRPTISIGLTTTTVYPDADPETTSVDGQVARIGTNLTWADIHDGAGTATGTNSSGEGMAEYIEMGTSTDRYNGLVRAIFLFDTSSIPDTDVISAATITLYSIIKNDQSLSTKANIYSSSPASNTDIVAGDYQNVGTTPFSTDILFANWATSAAPGSANDFALNASGLAAISKTGVSKFSMREVVYDVANVAPTWVSGGFERMHAQTSESTGGNDPRLVVTHAAASGPANLKSYNTNLKANTKSINTNAIANVKSLDTNA